MNCACPTGSWNGYQTPGLSHASVNRESYLESVKLHGSGFLDFGPESVSLL